MGISQNVKTTLTESFDEVVSVEELDSGDISNLTLLDRTELGITFTNIRCWTLTQYNKCVFLDADTLVLTNSDELFDREEFSAAPDAGWPDCFNSGVFVFRPNLNTYRDLINHATTTGSFDGGDQGLLNTFFSDWATKDISRHLPFTYNMVASATYSYLPAFKKFGKNVHIIHFIGAAKPWKTCFDGSGNAILGSVEKHTGITCASGGRSLQQRSSLLWQCMVRVRLPGPPRQFLVWCLAWVQSTARHHHHLLWIRENPGKQADLTTMALQASARSLRKWTRLLRTPL